MFWVGNAQLVYLKIQVYIVYTIYNQPQLHSIYKHSSYTTKTLQGYDFALSRYTKNERNASSILEHVESPSLEVDMFLVEASGERDNDGSLRNFIDYGNSKAVEFGETKIEQR